MFLHTNWYIFPPHSVTPVSTLIQHFISFFFLFCLPLSLYSLFSSNLQPRLPLSFFIGVITTLPSAVIGRLWSPICDAHGWPLALRRHHALISQRWEAARPLLNWWKGCVRVYVQAITYYIGPQKLRPPSLSFIFPPSSLMKSHNGNFQLTNKKKNWIHSSRTHSDGTDADELLFSISIHKNFDRLPVAHVLISPGWMSF